MHKITTLLTNEPKQDPENDEKRQEERKQEQKMKEEMERKQVEEDTRREVEVDVIASQESSEAVEQLEKVKKETFKQMLKEKKKAEKLQSKVEELLQQIKSREEIADLFKAPLPGNEIPYKKGVLMKATDVSYINEKERLFVFKGITLYWFKNVDTDKEKMYPLGKINFDGGIMSLKINEEKNQINIKTMQKKYKLRSKKGLEDIKEWWQLFQNAMNSGDEKEKEVEVDGIQEPEQPNINELLQSVFIDYQPPSTTMLQSTDDRRMIRLRATQSVDDKEMIKYQQLQQKLQVNEVLLDFVYILFFFCI